MIGAALAALWLQGGGTLAGTVQADSSHEPVARARVELAGGGRSAVADEHSAYARYVREVAGTEAVARGHAAAGLHGALGLFAGAAPARRTITFVPLPQEKHSMRRP